LLLGERPVTKVQRNKLLSVARELMGVAATELDTGTPADEALLTELNELADLVDRHTAVSQQAAA
jgi:hypothetical protein